MKNKSLKTTKDAAFDNNYCNIDRTIIYCPCSMSTSNLTGPNAYGYDNMRITGDKQSYLKFVSATEMNGDMNNTSNSVQTQIPESAKGPTIPEKGYLVEEIRDNLYG